MRQLRLLPLLLALLVGSLESPASAARFVEEVVSFETHDGLVLEGILSYPSAREGPFPGLLMIAGSGLTDADVTIRPSAFNLTDGTQKVFREIARTFSKKGFAVLRYNKRGTTFGLLRTDPDLLASSSIDDVIEDARSALAALTSHPVTAAAPLSIFGWSQGGYIAAQIARESGIVDLLVLMAPAAFGYEDDLRYQASERYLDFFEQAVDLDGDGFLTLGEFDALDGNFGLGSFWVLTSVEELFGVSSFPPRASQIEGFSPEIDVDGDGRLSLAGEVRPVFEAGAADAIARRRSGELGLQCQSWLELPANLKQIRKTGARTIIVAGTADTQTRLAGTLALVDRLERKPSRPVDLLVIEGLGHTLAPPRDFVKTDGGLTVFDNLTFNAPSKQTILQIFRRVKKAIRDIRRE